MFYEIEVQLLLCGEQDFIVRKTTYFQSENLALLKIPVKIILPSSLHLAANYLSYIN